MKTIKQINNLIIKQKGLGEITSFTGAYMLNRYVVFAPKGICLEDNLTLEQAEEFCKNTLDFKTKK